MARGITETDVHTAADELVAKGERPTVERIRAHIGTGSPNTVIRWLDTWWQGLGPRLHQHTQRMTLPEAPEEVGRLAQQLWEQALIAAQAVATADLTDQLAELDTQRRQLAEQERHSLLQLAKNADALREVEALLAQRDTELAYARALIERQDRQLADALGQREVAEHGRATLEAQLAEALTQQQRAAVTAHAEREALRAHAIAVENRSLQEVDRARQESKQARIELQARTRQWEADLRASSQREALTRKAMLQQERELTALRKQLQTRTQSRSVSKVASVRKRGASTAKRTYKTD